MAQHTQQMQTPEKMYSPREVMELLGFNSKTNHTVHRLIDSGQLRAVRLNSRVIRIPGSSIVDFQKGESSR